MHTPDQNDSAAGELQEAPPALISALRQATEVPVFIPPTVDEAILRTARNQLEKPTPRKLAWTLLFRWAAGFASVLVVLWLAQLLTRSGVEPAPDLILAREDLNHDGQVDILDAFALARQLKGARVMDLRFDLNHDGAVDERDVATIAAQAVSLAKGGHS